MSNVSLTSASFRAATTTAAASGVPGTITDPPPQVLQLAHGTFLRGEVLGRDQQGHVQVRTELGTLSLLTRAQLPEGSQVTLHVRSSGSSLHVAVMQVDGHTPRLQGQAAPASPARVQAPAAGTAPGTGPADANLVARPAGVPGTIISPPSSASNLANGSTLEGIVLGRHGDGPLLLRTELGTLPLSTAAQLNSGQKVTLQVRTTAPQINVVITQIQAPPPEGNAVARPSAPFIAAPQGQGLSTGDLLSLGQTIRATVQGTSGGGGAAGQVPAEGHGVPRLAPGSELQVRVLAVQAAQQLAGTTPAQSTVGPSPLAPIPSQALAGGMMGPAASTLEPIAEGAANGALRVTGAVIGTATGGRPVIQTALGALALDINAQLAPGARVTIEISSADLFRPPASPLATAASDPASLAYAWPALERALEILGQSEDPVAQASLGSQGPAPALPQPGPRLTSSMLFFLTALTGGDPGGWFEGLLGGQAARLFDRAGQRELRTRMASDLQQLGRISELAGPDWRLLPIPLFDGNQLHQMRLFLRRRHGDGGHNGDDRQADATRFLLEVELSQLGDLQLDGLVQPKRFDLILRTRRGLPEYMRQEVTRIFRDANEIAGFAGEIAFQASLDWAPMPLAKGSTAPSELLA